MPTSRDAAILDVILRRKGHFGLDTDSKLRALSNRLTAQALFTALGGAKSLRSFSKRIAALLAVTQAVGVEYQLSLNTPHYDKPDTFEAPSHDEPVEYYLRLVFRSVEAAYYQFGLFPNLDSPLVLRSARKRAGVSQYLHITLRGADCLDSFLAECRRNPHLLRVARSSARAFQRAPSNAV